MSGLWVCLVRGGYAPGGGCLLPGGLWSGGRGCLLRGVCLVQGVSAPGGVLSGLGGLLPGGCLLWEGSPIPGHWVV